MQVSNTVALARPSRGRAERRLSQWLEQADVRIDGDRPWDLRVRDARFFPRVVGDGSLGLGESYMDLWWDCEQLDGFFHRVLSAHLDWKVRVAGAGDVLLAKLFNLQSKRPAQEVARRHYDLGNRLFERMLDARMQYTCGYWKAARTLDEAQEAKLALIAEKIELKPGMEILELGGGYGGLARYLAEEHRCRVVSYNISTEQVRYARELCAGLPVKIMRADYREAEGTFDRVVSVGLMEHIGPKNYRSAMELVHRCLKPDGLFLLHTIGSNRTLPVADAWFRKYIFPHGHLPSIQQVGAAMEKLFVMEDWHNFGADYDRTLMAWHDNFRAAWPELAPDYDERFYRMWSYYLLSCAGGFRARNIQLWQLVLSKGRPGVYQAVR